MSDIIEELKQRLGAWEPQLAERTVGTVERVADGIISISGLPNTKAGELLHVETDSGPISAMALNLERETIGAVILGDYKKVEVDMTVIGTGEVADVPVGPGLKGRTVNALGEPMDGRGAIKATSRLPIERVAPGVIARKGVHQPLQTGILAVDSMIPIGRGQRELIVGDRGTGKTAVALDAILAQKDTGVTCIYVAIGQKESKVAKIRALLEERDALGNVIIVSASASDPAAMQYVAPYSACAMGEYFMEQGEDALIVYDDLTKHAWAYREISLLLRRPPGREAYPGDVFYLHSRLLERAAKLDDGFGGGSLTALPIIETQAGDISAYIPTNVISITDGQIYLEADLFNQGVRPAVNAGASVSRVGRAAQTKIMKDMSGRLRLDLAQFRELASFAQFGSDLDEDTRTKIDRGRRLTELLKQPQYDPIPVAIQGVLLYGATKGFMDGVAPAQVSGLARDLRERLELAHASLLEGIAASGELSDTAAQELDALLPLLIKDYQAS